MDLKNKNVVFVPIYSMRDYKTGLYKLNCDGNMARVLSIIFESDVKEVMLFVPKYEMIDKQDFEELCFKLVAKKLYTKISFVYSSMYKDNAKGTRENKCVEDILLGLARTNVTDMLVIEPQGILQELIKDESIKNEKLLYWCVASETAHYSPWFTRDYKEIDVEIAGRIKTACATENQVKYLKGRSYKETFYNPTFSDIKIIFFPFRLSDPSYQPQLFSEMIDRLFYEGIRNFKVLITDPNGSNIAISNSVLVNSDHSIYTAILKGKPIVPYFEVADEVKHISIEEMCMYKCEVICYDNKEIQDGENIHKVDCLETFYQTLKNLIIC